MVSKTPTEEGSPKVSFEMAVEQLQLSVRKLESGELSLEESLKQFEEGVRLTRVCQEYLTAAEQKIEILTKGSPSSGPELQSFHPHLSE